MYGEKTTRRFPGRVESRSVRVIIIIVLGTHERSDELFGVVQCVVGGQDDAVDDVLFVSRRRVRFHQHHVVAGTAAVGRHLRRDAARVVPERRAVKRRRRVGLMLPALLLLLFAQRFDGRGHGAGHQYQTDDERTGCKE